MLSGESFAMRSVTVKRILITKAIIHSSTAPARVCLRVVSRDSQPALISDLIRSKLVDATWYLCMRKNRPNTEDDNCAGTLAFTSWLRYGLSWLSVVAHAELIIGNQRFAYASGSGERRSRRPRNDRSFDKLKFTKYLLGTFIDAPDKSMRVF